MQSGEILEGIQVVGKFVGRRYLFHLEWFCSDRKGGNDWVLPNLDRRIYRHRISPGYSLWRTFEYHTMTYTSLSTSILTSQWPSSSIFVVAHDWTCWPLYSMWVRCEIILPHPVSPHRELPMHQHWELQHQQIDIMVGEGKDIWTRDLNTWSTNGLCCCQCIWRTHHPFKVTRRAWLVCLGGGESWRSSMVYSMSSRGSTSQGLSLCRRMTNVEPGGIHSIHAQ